ncbi:MAG: hypothetical protein MHM6MM_003840 [Cercozoa sp. M6MM]
MSLRAALNPLIKSTTLANGLRVVTEKSGAGANSKTAAVSLMFQSGSRYEKVPGAASALAQSLAVQKGLSVEIDEDFLTLSMRTTSQDGKLSNASQLLSVLDGVEKATAAHALPYEFHGSANIEEEMMRRVQQDVFEGTLGYAQPSAEQLALLTEEEVQRHAKLLKAKQAVVVAVGDVEHEAFVEEVDKHLSSLAAGKYLNEANLNVHENFVGQHIEQRHDNWPFAHALLVFATEGLENPQMMANLEVFKQLLGRYSAKDRAQGVVDYRPLVREIADQDTVEHFHAVQTAGLGHGLFGVYGVTQDTRLYDLCSHSMRAMSGTVTQTVYDMPQFEWLKTAAVTERLTAQDTPAKRAIAVAKQLLSEDVVLTPAQQMALIDAVTPDTLMDTAKAVCYAREHALVGYGPTFEIPDINFMRLHAEGKLA